MASDEGVDASNNQGGDWEVVSLTASTYAASPTPKEEVDSIDEDDTSQDEGHAESSDILLMSKHFAYPPSSQEQKGQVGEDAKESKFWDKEEKDWTFKGLNFSDEFPGTEFFDSKDKGFQFEGGNFGDAKSAQEFDPFSKEQNLYTATTSSLHAEAALGVPTFIMKSKITSDDDAMHDTAPLCAPPDSLHSSEPNEGDKSERTNSRDPCGCWWKRGAAALFAQAKDANAFWSIFISGTVIGLVILGNRWQKERWQVLQLRWHLSINMSNVADPAD
ncbi:hypothetical protein MLD38_015554 [Melastoma candidum]|uniref:Uncharacterized protein n=1 Tax=Melastoma candidum TaxID=119954 RepID=A0ACB9RPY0_9MYRT|nr:hypothetical protein MLD38_015554 [Melastoma candidum]